LDRNVAMSKGFYCFSKELSEKEFKELKLKGKVRDTISSGLKKLANLGLYFRK